MMAVTPRGDNQCMTQQLRLLDGGKRSQPIRRNAWQLDAKTRRIGRNGVAQARRMLEQAMDETGDTASTLPRTG